MLKFERGGILVAELLPDLAPKTVRTVVEMLPLSAVVFHTRWCGREIYVPVTTGSPVGREHQTSQTNTGDLIFWREWDDDSPAPEGAISVYYGPELTRDHRGFLQVNVFGRVPQSQWKAIEEIGLRIWQKGTEHVEILTASAEDDVEQA